ncbi:hypothetical protein [uncultured Mucilaginibacter sp.]|uniref:hypothetical protein n=1 Tax=uncultured Mucilaginibacter sp. TaxID=797541 RepID=UPI0025CCC28D|nr:hypothetical protein [uncultured Mucilaginibacter sp.]
MKISNFTLVTLTALIVVLCTASCKKGEQANDKTISKKEFALQIGKSLYQSFNQTGTKAVASRKGTLSYTERSVQPACGSSTDSVINSYISSNGLTQTVKGFLRLTYLCTGGNNVLNGYALRDSIHTIKETAAAREEMTVKEDYVALGSFGAVTINGKQNSHVKYDSKTGEAKNIDQYNEFILQDLFFAPTGFQSARIPYKAKGTYNGNSFDFEGYIQFYFDVKFLVSVGGETYWVNPADWSITEKI